ncbi:S1/P1 nuclease [Terriglobus aquaticus]|uniref:S1/P1 nuclease n=1 Tax=Terriglobus aquaticus TaxID=940139 RepID=A0ABW9KNY1_9BACT|nr:S1/P1 nuclease [Terriglobus aquaticus]
MLLGMVSRLHTLPRRAVLCAALLLPCLTTPAHAWGPQGHKLVAMVAMEHLTPTAKKNIKFLLGKETLADVASWPDVYRPLETQTGPWHYVDIPEGAGTYDRERDCPTQPNVKAGSPGDKWRDCVVDRILFFEGRIGDATLDPADRAIALKYLVHFVGDIHQPLHTTGVQKGGNGITVNVFGSDTCGKYPCNLHSVWDSGLILHRQLNDKQYLALLDHEFASTPPAATPDDPATWANEGNALLPGLMLPQGGVVDQAYFDREIPVVDRQLEVAGLRLAAVLNRTFTSAPVTFKPAAADSKQF